MGFLDRLLGREEPAPNRSPQNGAATPQPEAPGQAGAPGPARSEDEIAVERYRYLLRTAPPETIEQVHEEAFARLTPDQRRLLFQQLSESAPAGEQPRGDDPRSLAQAATRSELRQPGTLERALGGGRGPGYGGMGFGSMFAGSLLGSVAGYVIGSALVSAFLPSPWDGQAAGGAGDQSGDDQNANDQNANDQGGDGGASDGGSGDVQAAGWDGGGDTSGGDAGGWGGDQGGGDWGGFGGGDFGGGDFI